MKPGDLILISDGLNYPIYSRLHKSSKETFGVVLYHETDHDNDPGYVKIINENGKIELIDLAQIAGLQAGIPGLEDAKICRHRTIKVVKENGKY
tara:strand:+ start:314 stop:595 length:282 start_codon:yes stop_codon:yes gene_type:complete